MISCLPLFPWNRWTGPCLTDRETIADPCRSVWTPRGYSINFGWQERSYQLCSSIVFVLLIFYSYFIRFFVFTTTKFLFFCIPDFKSLYFPRVGTPDGSEYPDRANPSLRLYIFIFFFSISTCPIKFDIIIIIVSWLDIFSRYPTVDNQQDLRPRFLQLISF